MNGVGLSQLGTKIITISEIDEKIVSFNKGGLIH
jgi:hypothetical protein